MENANQKTRLIIYQVLHWSIFIIMPFLFLRFTDVVKDFGWYLIYFILIFPIIFVIFLFVIRKKFKSKMFKEYKKALYSSWIIFAIVYVLMLFYIHRLTVGMFSHFRFPV